MKEDSFLDISAAEKILPMAQIMDPLVGDVKKKRLIESIETKIVTMGSCFAQNIQRALNRYQFDVYFDRNICGHYTARSIRETLQWVAEEKKHDTSELYYHSEDDVCSYRHFRIRKYGVNAEQEVLKGVEFLDTEFRARLVDADIIILTLGTSLIWKHDTTEHCICCFSGMPVDSFEKEEQSVDDIKKDLASIYTYIKKIKGNNDFHLMFTVSPQRYRFDEKYTGMPFLQYNTYSKAKNILAVHEFIQTSGGDNVTYFPSYEMVVDELRPFETMSNYDYLHIRQQHTPDYVVKRFLQSYASEETIGLLSFIEEFESLVGLTHARAKNNAELDSNHIKPYWDELLHKLASFKCNRDIGQRRIAEHYLDRVGKSEWFAT